MSTLGIYISVPFCRSKCSYCNFASGVFPTESHERYVARVNDEIRGARRQTAEVGAALPELVDSIYLGGGTPSILAPELLRRLFQGLRAEFVMTDDAEITLECAPGQLSDEVLAAALECGVNRMSFGVQSFVDREAAVTGRLHTREIALRDIERVREAGIRSVSVDLIAGLPHQSASSWLESLEVLLQSGVDHASVYMFEVDEDSRLGREVMAGGGRYHAGTVPSDDEMADFYLAAVESLGRAGLQQYEISNFARGGRESVHNKKYWQRRPYIGFGLDAHSMLPGVDSGAVRFQFTDDLEGFLASSGISDVQAVSPEQSLEEAWFLGLRLKEGVELGALEREFGRREVEAYSSRIEELLDSGLLERAPGRVRLTSQGRLLSNEVFASFLDDAIAQETELIVVD